VEALLPARQGRLLFCYLVLFRRRPVGRDELVEALWPQRSPVDSQAALNTLVARLRVALGADSVGGRSELSLVLGADPWIDVEVAQTAVVAGRAALEIGRASDARSCAEQALEIVEQPLLRDLDRSWLDDQRRLLEALRPDLLATLGQACLALGGSALAPGTDAARQLAALEPFRESARALLMRLLASSGDISEAVRVYHDLRVHLRDELGTVPSPQLTVLHEQLLTAPENIIRGGEGAGSSAGSVLRGQDQVLQRSRADAAHGGPPEREPRLTLPRALQPAAGRQLEHLVRDWADDVEGHRLVVISGEAGIGKTRVAAELATAVHGEGCRVLYGRCDEGLAVPYQPFVEALRSLLQTVDTEYLRSELGGLAAELTRVLPELTDDGSPAPADAESARFALFEAVVALLEITTAKTRTLLVIDDVQWAAPATLLLLRHIIRCERPLGLRIVVTLRSTELRPGEPLAQLLADLQRDNSARQITLTGLDEQAIEKLLRAAVDPSLADRTSQLVAEPATATPLEQATGQTVPTSEVVRLLAIQTAGNPFFLRELLAHLIESGTISLKSPSSIAITGAQLRAPEGLRHVIGQRVARLPAPARRALRAAAVAGSTFSFVLLERILGEGTDVLDALDEAVAAGLLIEAEHGNYVFAHALVRQTIYDQLSAARRIRLHRQLGEALEAIEDPDAHIEALAYHFAQAAADGQGAKAADYALAAGRSATTRLGYEDAAAHYERAIHALTLTGQPQATTSCTTAPR
jgi:DNA-binding SARP family transcriptional activator